MRAIFLQSRSVILAVATLVAPLSVDAGVLRDGQRFDPGAAMTAPAEGAPEQTALLSPLVGQWDVEFEWWQNDSLAHTANGAAQITLMNRGHGLMKRLHVDNFDGQGHTLDTIAFMGYAKGASDWSIGIANSFTENVTVFSNGDLAGNGLTVENIARIGGSTTLTHQRLVIDNLGNEANDKFTVTLSQGPLHEPPSRAWHARFTRRETRSDFMKREGGHGSPAPDRVDEAAQFDFLIGEWNETQTMKFPNGQEATWPSVGTAVHVLDGHAMMEFTSYDVDPRLPDAATTIVRIYNRVMRRWECMFVTNRFNNILYFGGVLEGDRIVLHQFQASNAGGPFSHWIFHDLKADSYGWYAHTSRDRGATFEKTWIITGQRKTD